MMMIRYVGLDVHKRVIEACVIDGGGQVLLRKRFALNRGALLAFIEQTLTTQDRVALEATTNTWAVAALLRGRVGAVVVSNPLQTRAIAQAKVKTDKVDALVLAQLLRCEYLPGVWQPDEPTQQLRSLTHRRASLVSDRTAIKNRLHSVLHQRMIEVPAGKLFQGRGRRWLESLDVDEQGRRMIDSDLRLLASVESEIQNLDEQLVKLGYRDERVKLLMTLPGVDVTVAQTVVAALGDIERFTDGDHAASYLGLVPSTKQSADHCYHGPITKAGSSKARWMLIQAAQHLDTHPGPLGVFFRRLAKRKNRNVAVVATARKLVVIAWHMLRHGEPYRYAAPRRTHEKLQRLRVQATGRRRRPGTARPPRETEAGPPRGGNRNTRSLPDVYALEELPRLRPLPPGEVRMLRETATLQAVEALTRSTLP